MNKMPLLGLCPIGKFVFSHEDALRQKKKIENKLRGMNIPFAGIDDAVTDGIARGTRDIEAAVNRLKEQKIEALFMPHCNFGTEHAVGLMARELGVPVLVWGPRDGAPQPDGTRLRDSLCGLFASTKVLHKMKIPYTYIENCDVDDATFEKGMDTFLRATNIASVFRKGIRIGHIGQRIDFFWTTIINESELLERFRTEVLPIDMVEFVQDVKNLAEKNRGAYLDEIAQLRKDIEIKNFSSDDPLVNVLAVRDRIFEWVESEHLDGIAFQDFMSIINESGAYCSYAESCVADKIPLGYESDIHGTISGILLKKAAFDEQSVFLTEYTSRHPENDNGVLMWHAGAPLSMCHPDVKIRLDKHWILPSDLSGMTHFKLKDGPVTVCRFDGDHSEYKLGYGRGKTINGPDTLNNYLWMEVDNWSRWEKTLMKEPFIHHAAMAYGDYTDAFAESCRYVNGLDGVLLGA